MAATTEETEFEAKLAQLRERINNLAALRAEADALGIQIAGLAEQHTKRAAVAAVNDGKIQPQPKELQAARSRLADIRSLIPDAEQYIEEQAKLIQAAAIAAFTGAETKIEEAANAAERELQESMAKTAAMMEAFETGPKLRLRRFRALASDLIGAKSSDEIVNAIQALRTE